MRAVTFLLITFLQSSIICFAREATFLWPIEKADFTDKSVLSFDIKEQAILHRPDGYIEGEYNFANLFLTAQEGTPIVSPVDGEIILFGYSYQPSLITSGRLGVATFSGNFEEDKQKMLDFVNSGRAWVSTVDAKYISIMVGIKIADGRTIWITGIHPTKQLKTGEKIKQGDLLGTMGYSYKSIKQPSINVAISEKDATASDP